MFGWGRLVFLLLEFLLQVRLAVLALAVLAQLGSLALLALRQLALPARLDLLGSLLSLAVVQTHRLVLGAF